MALLPSSSPAWYPRTAGRALRAAVLAATHRASPRAPQARLSGRAGYKPASEFVDRFSYSAPTEPTISLILLLNYLDVTVPEAHTMIRSVPHSAVIGPSKRGRCFG